MYRRTQNNLFYLQKNMNKMILDNEIIMHTNYKIFSTHFSFSIKSKMKLRKFFLRYNSNVARHLEKKAKPIRAINMLKKRNKKKKIQQ